MKKIIVFIFFSLSLIAKFKENTKTAKINNHTLVYSTENMNKENDCLVISTEEDHLQPSMTPSELEKIESHATSLGKKCVEAFGNSKTPLFESLLKSGFTNRLKENNDKSFVVLRKKLN
jgi:hypothetical protein